MLINPGTNDIYIDGSVAVLGHHSVAYDLITKLRNKDTSTETFRLSTDALTRMLVYEATSSLPTESVTIESPLCPLVGTMLSSQSRIIFVPILRAGESMVAGALSMFKGAAIAPVDISRNEETAMPTIRSVKLPKKFQPTDIIITLDPMLATGGSLSSTIGVIKVRGGKNIRSIAIFSAPEGLEHMKSDHPDVTIYTATVDSHLDDRAYIVPGCGDFGDRYFNIEI